MPQKSRDTRSLMGGFNVFTEMEKAIHRGKAYSFSLSGTVVNGATHKEYLTFTTGDEQLHFHEIYGGFAQGGMYVTLYKDAVIDVPGSPVKPVNMNDASSNTALMTLYPDATLSDLGTELPGRFYPETGHGVNVESASGSIAKGRVLAANTTYVIELYNAATLGDTPFSLTFEGHESDIILGDA